MIACRIKNDMGNHPTIEAANGDSVADRADQLGPRASPTVMSAWMWIACLAESRLFIE